jgi:hypothetical protein
MTGLRLREEEPVVERLTRLNKGSEVKGEAMAFENVTADGHYCQVGDRIKYENAINNDGSLNFDDDGKTGVVVEEPLGPHASAHRTGAMYLAPDDGSEPVPLNARSAVYVG